MSSSDEGVPESELTGADVPESELPGAELSPANDKTLDALTKNAEQASRNVLKAELQVKARHNRVQDLEEMIVEARLNRDNMVDARDSLAGWLDERRRSLSIQLISHVDSELQRIKVD